MGGRNTLLQKYNVRAPVRDMRILDPSLLTSETGKILVRDNCIMVSVEHVRLIIMAEQVGASIMHIQLARAAAIVESCRACLCAGNAEAISFWWQLGERCPTKVWRSGHCSSGQDPPPIRSVCR